MRKQTVENQYSSALYKVKQYIRKGVPNLDENEKKDYESLLLIAEVCKSEIDAKKPHTTKKPYVRRNIPRSNINRYKAPEGEKKISVSMWILPSQKEKIIQKFGNFNKAIESLIIES